MRRLTNLENYPVDTIFQMFAHCADNNGELSRAAFNGCFGALIGEPESEAHRKRAGAVLGRLFDLFDVDGNGVVSFDELASGLSIMCGGSRDEKVRAAFGLFDLDGNGFIEWEEMVRYLSSVFRILYETTPDTQERLKVTPDELAEVTADEAFCIGTSNELEALTFKQFKQWYTESGQGDAGVDDAPSTVSIEDIQAITTFSEYHVADAMNIISAAADDEGLLDEEAFSNCVLENFFVPTAGGGAKLAHEGYVKAVAAWLFQCFDADHNGFVDSAELISGLTILCVGSRQDKVRAAFSAFDQNGDGFISYAEMTAYLRSVFSLMFAVKPDIQGSVSVSADQLAEVTSQLQIGHGLAGMQHYGSGIEIGPLINTAGVDKVKRIVEDSVDKGAEVLVGGEHIQENFYSPTVIANVTTDMAAMTDEIFGPVAAVHRFTSEEEAIAIANDTNMGLASYFYSSDANRCWRFAAALEYGMVGINDGILSTEAAPFGGVKESGIGREGSSHGIDEYMEMKYMSWNLA
jgi:Ca2+-binding EF-hand superfamily protein